MKSIGEFLLIILYYETGSALDTPLKNPSSLVLQEPLILHCSYDHVKDLNKNGVDVTYLQRVKLEKIQDSPKGDSQKPISATVYPSTTSKHRRLYSINDNHRDIFFTFPDVNQGQRPRMFSRNTSIVLTIKHTECQDIGLYRCEVKAQGQIFSKFFYVNIADSSPVLSNDISNKILEVGSRATVTCKQNSSDPDVNLTFKIKPPSGNQTFDLPVDSTSFGVEQSSKQWPERPIEHTSTKLVGPCPGIDYWEYSSIMIFTVHWPFIINSEILCTAKSNNKMNTQGRLQPETMNRRYSFMSLKRSVCAHEPCTPSGNGTATSDNGHNNNTEPGEGAREKAARRHGNYTTLSTLEGKGNSTERLENTISNTSLPGGNDKDGEDEKEESDYDRELELNIHILYLVALILSGIIIILCFIMVYAFFAGRRRRKKRKAAKAGKAKNPVTGDGRTIDYNDVFDDDSFTTTSITTSGSSVDTNFTGLVTPPTDTGDPFQDALTSRYAPVYGFEKKKQSVLQSLSSKFGSTKTVASSTRKAEKKENSKAA